MGVVTLSVNVFVCNVKRRSVQHFAIERSSLFSAALLMRLTLKRVPGELHSHREASQSPDQTFLKCNFMSQPLPTAKYLWQAAWTKTSTE